MDQFAVSSEPFARGAEAWASRTRSWWGRLQDCRQVMMVYGADVVFDEIALLVADTNAEYALIEDAVRHGYSFTNSADDIVKTGPIPSEYGVHYSFLFHDELPFRLEIMRLTGGFSPLHVALWHGADLAAQAEGRHPGPIAVHASFKVPDEEEYLATVMSLDEHRADLLLSQTCRGDYGVYSYWKPTMNSIFAEGLYIKPRVNLRDGAQ